MSNRTANHAICSFLSLTLYVDCKRRTVLYTHVMQY